MYISLMPRPHPEGKGSDRFLGTVRKIRKDRDELLHPMKKCGKSDQTLSLQGRCLGTRLGVYVKLPVKATTSYYITLSSTLNNNHASCQL